MTDAFKKLFPNDFDSDPNNKNRFKDYYSNVLNEIKINPKRRKIKYLSLFTGIGGFEIAIHSIFPNAECIGYSEVKKHAIDVYSKHFPGHHNLGDVSAITREQIQSLVRDNGCDLIVGGFPCTNLSSLANMNGNTDGLDGPQSGLFWDMCHIIEWVKELNPKIKIIIENNASMKNIWKKIITDRLIDIVGNDIKLNHVNAKDSWIQIRNRLYWSNIIYTETVSDLSFIDILEHKDITIKEKLSEKFIEGCNRLWKMNIDKEYDSIILKKQDDIYQIKHIKTKGGKTRWSCSMHSDTIINVEHNNIDYKYPVGKARPIVGSNSINSFLLDRRDGNIIPRFFSCIERERLFLFPDNYTDTTTKTNRINLIGNTIIVYIVLGFIRNL